MKSKWTGPEKPVNTLVSRLSQKILIFHIKFKAYFRQTHTGIGFSPGVNSWNSFSAHAVSLLFAFELDFHGISGLFFFSRCDRFGSVIPFRSMVSSRIDLIFWYFVYPPVIKHGNGKLTINRSFSCIFQQKLHSFGIFQPAMFDDTRGYHSAPGHRSGSARHAGHAGVCVWRCCGEGLLFWVGTWENRFLSWLKNSKGDLRGKPTGPSGHNMFFFLIYPLVNWCNYGKIYHF